jgi:hypothetical protein
MSRNYRKLSWRRLSGSGRRKIERAIARGWEPGLSLSAMIQTSPTRRFTAAGRNGGG